MADEKVFYERGWLNPEAKGGLAAFEAEIEVSVSTFQGPHTSLSASFKISDCTRVVELDFGMYDHEDRPAPLAKLRRLITALQSFETTLKEHAKRVSKAS